MDEDKALNDHGKYTGIYQLFENSKPNLESPDTI